MLEKRDISYLHMSYLVMRKDLIPSKPILDVLLKAATKAKAADFLQTIYQDIETHNIEKVDSPKIKKKSSRGQKSRTNSYASKRKNRGSPPAVVVLPMGGSNKYFQKGKGDPISLLEDLSMLLGNYKMQEGEFDSDQSEFGTEDEDDDSDDSDDNKEDNTSDSENERK